MPTDSLLIVGAGGHAKVVIDALGFDRSTKLTVTSEVLAENGALLLGISVISPLDAALVAAAGAFHVAIGNNAVRQRLAGTLQAKGYSYRSILHQRAVVSPHAKVGAGSFIAAGAVVGPCAVIGVGCIINHGAIIDHDCVIGDFAHVAPNAAISGCARIGRRVLVGSGGRVLPGISVGDDCVLGAGAVVVSDLPHPGVYIGMPAHPK